MDGDACVPMTATVSVCTVFHCHLSSSRVTRMLAAHTENRSQYMVVESETKPPDIQISIIQCVSQAMINWEGCGRNGLRHRNGEMMEVHSLHGVWHPDGCICLCYLHLHHKIQKMASNNRQS